MRAASSETLDGTAEPGERGVGEALGVTHPLPGWCPRCIARRGLECRDGDGGGEGGDQDNQPYISLGCGYLAADATLTLVGKGRCSWIIFDMVVERKGAADPHVIIKLTEWVDALGSTKVAIRSGREQAIKQVAAAVRDSRQKGTVTTLENLPPGDQASNCIAERAVGRSRAWSGRSSQSWSTTPGECSGQRAALGHGSSTMLRA